LRLFGWKVALRLNILEDCAYTLQRCLSLHVLHDCVTAVRWRNPTDVAKGSAHALVGATYLVLGAGLLA
jgi:hypothetical protein